MVSILQFIDHVHTHPSHIPGETMAWRGSYSPKFTRLLNSKAGLGSRMPGSFHGPTMPLCMGACKYHQEHMCTVHTDASYWEAHLVYEQMLERSQQGFCRHTRSPQVSLNPSASGFFLAKRNHALRLGGVCIGLCVS